MKQKIFMYLFIFAALLVLFQYVNSKRYFDRVNDKIERKDSTILKYQDSLAVLKDEVFELSSFTFLKNQDAIDYFYDRGIDAHKLKVLIEDEIANLNDYNTEEHPLVPFTAVTEGKIIINTVRVLNHKWIIADFSNGKYWGEVFLTYELTENGDLKFSQKEAFWYPFN